MFCTLKQVREKTDKGLTNMFKIKKKGIRGVNNVVNMIIPAVRDGCDVEEMSISISID